MHINKTDASPLQSSKYVIPNPRSQGLPQAAKSEQVYFSPFGVRSFQQTILMHFMLVVHQSWAFSICEIVQYLEKPVCAACEPWKTGAQVERCPEQVLSMCFHDNAAVVPGCFSQMVSVLMPLANNSG